MAFWPITRQLRTAIELYREAIRFTAKSKVQNSFYGIQRECLDEWLCETWRGSAGSDSMPSATVALKKPFKSFSLFLSLSLSRKNNVNQIFNAGETKTNAGESKRELPTEKFTTISQERCLQFTTTNQETNKPKKCCCHFVSNALHSFLSFIERSLADVYSIDSSLLRWRNSF